MIDLVDLIDTYHQSYLILHRVGYGDFSDKEMISKVNANLSNKLGNLNQKILTLVLKNCNNAVPAEIEELMEEDKELLATAASRPGRTRDV